MGIKGGDQIGLSKTLFGGIALVDEFVSTDLLLRQSRDEEAIVITEAESFLDGPAPGSDE